MNFARQTGGPIVNDPMPVLVNHSPSSSSGCRCCGLCETLTEDLTCESCNAVRCLVCGVWIIAEEADMHIDECFEDQEVLHEVKMDTQARNSGSSRAHGVDPHSKKTKGKRKALHKTGVLAHNPKRISVKSTASQGNDIASSGGGENRSAQVSPMMQRLPSRPLSEGQFRLCDAQFYGCGERSSPAASSCQNCGRCIVSVPNSRGEKFVHGQEVWFLEANQGFSRAGHVVSIDSDTQVRIRYKEKHFAFPTYDEIHCINNISKNADLVTPSRRRRRPPSKATELFTFPTSQKMKKRAQAAEAMSTTSSSSSGSSLSRCREGRASKHAAEPKAAVHRKPKIANKSLQAGVTPSLPNGVVGNHGDDNIDDGSEDDDNSSIASHSSHSSDASELISSSSSACSDHTTTSNVIPAADAKRTTSHSRHPRPVITTLAMSGYPEGVNFEQMGAEYSGARRLQPLAQLRLFKLLIAWCFGKSTVDNTQSADGDALEPQAVQTILKHPDVKVPRGEQSTVVTPQHLLYTSAFCPTHPSQFEAIPPLCEAGALRYRSQLSTLNSLFLFKHKTTRDEFDGCAYAAFTTLYRPPRMWPDISSLRENHPIERDATLNLYQFRVLLDMAFQTGFGSRQQLENSAKIKGNRKQANGENAMYGSIQPLLVDMIISKCQLRPDQRFIDIGSGIGQVVLQVSACVGAHSVGIEIDVERHYSGVRLQEVFQELHQEFGGMRMCDRARLICGGFSQHKNEIRKANVMFLNNFGGWWSSEKSGPSTRSLEDQVIELLKETAEGTQIVTLSPLYDACGWMDLEEFISPDSATSWIHDPIKLYRYTKKDFWQCAGCTLENRIFSDQCVLCGCRRSRRERITRSST